MLGATAAWYGVLLVVCFTCVFVRRESSFCWLVDAYRGAAAALFRLQVLVEGRKFRFGHQTFTVGDVVRLSSPDLVRR